MVTPVSGLLNIEPVSRVSQQSSDDRYIRTLKRGGKTTQRTAILSLLAPTGNNAQASFLVHHTVKTFGLLQPYFGHLSCMPVVYVTRYKLQGMLPI